MVFVIVFSGGMARVFEDVSGKSPNLFVAGVPKAGTTSMHAYLDQHPDVLMSSLKEPYYFAKDLAIPWKVRDLEEYLGLFSKRRSVRYSGESSPLYMYSETAARRIHEFNPESRIIVLLRNPVDMLNSLHGQFLYTDNEDILSFEEALDAQEPRNRGERIPRNCAEPRVLQYLKIADFVPQLDRFLEHFGSEQVETVFFDDLKEDPTGTYRRILRFLELDEGFEADFKVHNRAKVLPNLRLRAFLQNVPFVKVVLRFLVGKKRMGELRDRIGQLTQKQRQQEVPRELRRKLNHLFASMVGELEDRTGRSLDHWLA